MSKPLRAGVVGLTGIGAKRSAPGPGPGTGVEMPHSHVGAYLHVAATEPVAVCDIVPEKLDGFHRDWADVLPDTRGYTDYREMLDREQLDVISVATPDDRHAQIVVDAVAAGNPALARLVGFDDDGTQVAAAHARLRADVPEDQL